MDDDATAAAAEGQPSNSSKPQNIWYEKGKKEDVSAFLLLAAGRKIKNTRIDRLVQNRTTIITMDLKIKSHSN